MKKLDPKKIIGFLVITLFTISGNLYSQSSSFGNTYIFNNGEMGVVDMQHNFLNGGSGIQPGIVGTDRTTTQGFMSFVGSASWTGASNSAFVDGYVKTYMTTAFTFPIGDNAKYRPAAIATASLANPVNAAYYGVSATTSITSSLRGGNEPVLPASGPFNTSLMGAGVLSVDNVEYWDINGTAATKITLTWDATSAVSSLSSVGILGWNGTQWVAIASTVDATSLLGGSSSLTSGSITTNAALVPNTYEIYTLGSVCGLGVAPALSSYNLGNICPATTIDLNASVTSSTPAGTSLVWFTNTTHTGSAFATPETAGVGTYYAFYYDSVNNCYTAGTKAVTTAIAPSPDTPTESSIIQTSCVLATGTIVLNPQSGVEYSINNGTTYQSSPTFTGLAAGNYTLKVRSTISIACSATGASTITIFPVPSTPTLSTTNLNNLCPELTANLNSIVTSSVPYGTTLVWFTNSEHTGTAYATPTAATVGTYYAYYFDSVNNCYTPASAAVTTSLDSDCDGIADLADIDDDNDGILDTVEDNCTADKSGLTLSVTPGFEGPTSGMVTTGNGLIDGITNQNTICWGSVPYVNRTILTFTFAKPTSLKGMELSVYPTTSTILSAGNVVELQAFNGTSWVSLATYTHSTIQPSLIISYPNVIGFYPTQINPYTQYRIFGVNAVLGPGGIFMSEAIMDIQPLCIKDVDGDGIPNSLDLDSDGDGCPDAKEAGVSGTLLVGNIVNGIPNATTPNVSNAIAQGPYGSNGLANSLETNDSSIASTSYLSTYISNATSAVLNACSDTDGDGIFDLVDIDDDNDGILDAVEAPSCYYTALEASVISSVTSQFISSSQTDIINCHDNSADTFASFTPSTVTNQEIYNITPLLSPLSVSAVSFDMNNYSILSGTATAILQGFNGTTWIDLSTAQTATVINGTQTFTNTLHPTIPYLKFRLYGVSGSSSYAYCTEIHLIPSAGSYGSSAPKPTCLVDTDGDGKTNDKDLDSDGDLCPDAKEAGVTGTLLSGTLFNSSGSTTAINALISGDVGINGLANSLETNDTASGITTYISSYTPIATSMVLNACSDTDGDGIGDLVDIDDDNDGTLDAVEAPSCYFNASEITIPSTVTTELTISAGSMAMVYDNNATTTQSFNAQDIVGKSIYEVTPVSAIAITSLNLNATTNIFAATNRIKLQGWTGASWIDLSVTAAAPAVNASGVIAFTNTINTVVAYPKYRLYGDATSTGNINSNVVSEITLSPTAYQASKNPKSTCTVNTDGDLLTNDKDPDSDGDNCSDAKEASATTSTAANYAFGAPYGTNGLSDALETSVDSGIINYPSTYQYAISTSLNACADSDGDGIFDLVDIDDDNDGILDIVEQTCTSPIVSKVGVTVSTTLTPGTGTISNLLNGTETTDFYYSGQNIAGQVVAQFNFPASHILNKLEIITSGGNFFTTATVKVQGSNNGTSWTDVSGLLTPVTSTASTFSTNPSHKFDISSNTNYYTQYRILGVSGAVNGGPWVYEAYFSELTCVDIDTDGDTIPNRLELDSDHDGCSDAKEAGATTSNTTNYVFTGAVGANGLANILETASESGIVNYSLTYANATNNAIKSCVITCPTITNSASNNFNPTTCTGTNGSIKLCGLVAGEADYVINYAKNGTAATPLTNLTADTSGCLLIANLGEGVYSNIIITHPIYCTNGTSAVGPITITAPAGPSVPSANTTQPTCSVSTGTIVLTIQSGVEYSINNGFSYQPSPTFAALSPGNYTLKVRSTTDPTCSTIGASPVSINSVPSLPSTPTVSVTVQPTCEIITATVVVSSPAQGTGFEYSIDGGVYQASSTFTVSTEGSHAITIRRISDVTCVSNSAFVNVYGYICAITETTPAINGGSGGNTSPLTNNDTLNGIPVTVGSGGNVTISLPNPLPTGLTLNTNTGVVTVAPNTQAGTYPVIYTICEVVNPSNCDTVTSYVVVTAPVIDAVTETTPSVNGGSGGNTPSLITNDTLNGLPVTVGTGGNVTISVPNPLPTGLTLNTNTGVVTVAPNTQAGTYPVTYRICEVVNPSNCDTVTSYVLVNAPVIDAVTETTPAINGGSGGNTSPLTNNDTLNGIPVTVGSGGNVTISVPNPLPTGLTLNTNTGVVTVAPNTPTGTYPVTYTICEVVNPSNCDTVTSYVEVIVTDFTPTIDIDNVVFLSSGVTKDFVVNISDIDSGPSIGQVVFKIFKQSAFTITYNPVTTISNVGGGTMVNNNDWIITEDPLFITVTLKLNVLINASSFSSVGFTITRNSSIPPQTWQPITATIVTGSGGDSLDENNTYNVLVKAQ